MQYRALVLATLLCPLFCFSQNTYHPDTTFRIRLKDGSRVKGKLVSRDNGNWVLRSADYGTITLLKDSIKRISTAFGIYKNERVEFPNPASSHYFVASTAIPLKKGEFYFQNSELFFNKINCGVTNNISIGIGADFSPIVEYDPVEYGPIVMVDIKAGGKINEWLYLGGKALIIATPYSVRDYYDEEESTKYNIATIAMGLATFGNANNNLTAGVGYFHVSEFTASGPIFTLSGMLRVGQRVSLISETWVGPESGTVYVFDRGDYYEGNNSLQYYFLTAYGVRIMGKKLAFDIGLANNNYIAQSTIIGFPYFGFMIKI